MQPNCLNCSAPVLPDHSFCGHCGQKVAVHRLTVPHLVHESFHAFTHADKSIFALLKHLAVNPARVADEYVSGRRKKYFNPITFFLLCIGFFVFMNNVIKPYGEPPQPDPAIVSQLTPQQKTLYVTMINRTGEAMKFASKNGNIIFMIAMPFYAALIWLFFRNRGRNFAEITLAVILYTAFVNLLFTLLFTPLMKLYLGTPAYGYIMGGGMLLQLFYYAWAFKGFLHYKSRSGALKTFLVMLLAFVLWGLLSIIAMFFYVYRENTGKVLVGVWQALLKQI